MRKLMKWIGTGLLGLVVLILLAGVVLYATTSRRLDRAYTLPNEPITVPVDPVSISRGQRLVTARCGGCHGENSVGMVIFQDPMLGTISAPNLTAGRGIGGAGPRPLPARRARLRPLSSPCWGRARGAHPGAVPSARPPSSSPELVPRAPPSRPCPFATPFSDPSSVLYSPRRLPAGGCQTAQRVT